MVLMKGHLLIIEVDISFRQRSGCFLTPLIKALATIVI